jgi:hypothetical protein
MIRKFAIALSTTVLIGAAALAPTAASAHSHHHHWHGGYGYGFGLGLVGATLVAPAIIEPTCYYTKQKVWNGIGWTWQTVQVCG